MLLFSIFFCRIYLFPLDFSFLCFFVFFAIKQLKIGKHSYLVPVFPSFQFPSLFYSLANTQTFRKQLIIIRCFICLHVTTSSNNTKTFLKKHPRAYYCIACTARGFLFTSNISFPEFKNKQKQIQCSISPHIQL